MSKYRSADLRDVIVGVLREDPQVRSIGELADELVKALAPLMVAVDPGGCAPPILVPAFPADKS